MTGAWRPHVLGLDDGGFDKRADRDVPIVGVMMEGHDLVEGVAMTRFPVDGAGAAEFLAGWIPALRFVPALHGVVLGGITVAGLGVVDVELLSARLQLPVIVVHRHAPSDGQLERALAAAGLADRIPIVERTPRAWAHGPGLYVSHVGSTREEAARLVDACRGKSRLPEPLRLAHLIGGAAATGESHGRP